MVVTVLGCVVFILSPAVNFKLGNRVFAMLKNKITVSGKPAEYEIDTVDNLGFLPGICEVINAAVLSLVLLIFCNRCLVRIINKSSSRKAPFLAVSVKKINKISYRITRSNRRLKFGIVIYSFIKLNTLSLIGNTEKCHCDCIGRLLRICCIKSCGKLSKTLTFAVGV